MKRAYRLEDLAQLAESFGCGLRPKSLEVWGDGHIHQSFKLSLDTPAGSAPCSLLLQAVNLEVFPEPERLMQNLLAVTEYGRARLEARGVADAARRMLSVQRALDGGPLVRHAGELWRCFPFIEGTQSPKSIDSEPAAWELAHAFGAFIELLAGFDASELHVTLPDFHDTPKRLLNLRHAAQADAHGRALGVERELEFVEQRAGAMGFVVQGLAAGELSLRVTHNDTKLNNVLLDALDGKGLCVIDLDTVMAGSLLYDFGDMLRSSVSATPEDEPETERIRARPEIFRGLVAGFKAALGTSLSELERTLLFDAGVLITLEIGMRFLTDHLQGDSYYHISRAGHNLDRARAQFALVCSLEAQRDAFRRIAEKA